MEKMKGVLSLFRSGTGQKAAAGSLAFLGLFAFGLFWMQAKSGGGFAGDIRS